MTAGIRASVYRGRLRLSPRAPGEAAEEKPQQGGFRGEEEAAAAVPPPPRGDPPSPSRARASS